MLQSRMKFEPVTPHAFHMILLEPPAGTMPTQIRGSVGGIEPVTFTWNTRAFKPLLPLFRQFEARRLDGGSPKRTLSGHAVAVADVGARLVKLTHIEDGVSTVQHGVITIPAVSAGPGAGVSTISIMWHPCNELRYYGSTLVEEAP